ncbi:Uncharacterised protein [Vibrio cholerae]|nr:Uncharacterised protein [Vibrio cholerae]
MASRCRWVNINAGAHVHHIVNRFAFFNQDVAYLMVSKQVFSTIRLQERHQIANAANICPGKIYRFIQRIF